MKQKKRLYLLILLVLVCLVLLLTGTYAAYTNTAYAKRVVTTGIDTNAVPFSSNYLYEYNGVEYYKHIVPVSTAIPTSVPLVICNYPPRDNTRASSRDITYTLSISVVGKDGSATSLTPPSSTPAAGSYTLLGGQISTHQFEISFAPELVTTFNDCLVRITATSTNGLDTQTVLAAEFELISASEIASEWRGQFTDKEAPKDLDAFNYEVFGTAEGTITISWENAADYIALSKWSRDDLAPGSTGSSISFNVGGEGKPTSYLMQFYRLRGRTAEDRLPEINVTFVPKSAGTSTS